MSFPLLLFSIPLKNMFYNYLIFSMVALSLRIFKKYFVSYQKTVDFCSLEQDMAENYNIVRVFRNATVLAAVVMFFVMLMGLIGYTTNEVRHRSKEIAIRKVNGAESSTILEMLSRDVLWVAVPAVIMGTVGAWYVNGIWMDLFAIQVPLGGSVYVLVAIANLMIITACVVWKAWSIANENPVKSIKSE